MPRGLNRAFLVVLACLGLVRGAEAQCVADPVSAASLQFDIDYLFRGLDLTLGGSFPAWLNRYNQVNTTDPSAIFGSEDNAQNGIDDDDHLELLGAILAGEPAATVLAGIDPDDIADIRASFTANRAKVRPDLTLTIVFISVNIIDEINADDRAFGDSLQDLVAAYMTLGDAESLAYIRGLLITLGEIFIEQGVDAGDIPAFVEGTVKSTLRSTVNSNFVATRYACFGDAPGATKPNLLGDTGNIGGSANNNETEYALQGRNRQAWLIAKGVAKPPLEILSPPLGQTVPAGTRTVFDAVLAGGDGSTIGFDWKTVNPSNGVTAAYSTASPLIFEYPLAADAATYALYVCDDTWIRAAQPFAFSVTAAPFAIATQPQGGQANVGGTFTFSVAAQGGTALPTYQWLRGPNSSSLEPVDEATGRALVLSNVQLSDAGLYQVEVTSGATTLTSSRVALVVQSVADNVPPVVTLNGAAALSVACGAAFTDPGATAFDLVSGDVSDSIVVLGSVNTAVPGPYVLTYRAEDATGNLGEATRTVTVIDTSDPLLTLTGANPLVITCGAAFTDPGATASDTCAGTLTNAIVASGDVDTGTPGDYVRTYAVADPSGNAAQITRVVTVVDAAPPVLTLNGAATITLACGTPYVEAGATATDTCDTALDAVAISGTIDSNTPGSYTLTYTVSDTAGNEAVATRTVNVTDTAPPVLTLTGANPLVIACGATFTDPGATATDACAGVLDGVQASGAVNTGTPSEYTRTYTVSDPDGNPAQITRVVQVVDGVAPVISLTGAATLTLACGEAFNDPGATALDACEGALSTVVEGSVNTAVPGTYSLTYRASDAAGNEGEATRTVNVVDTVPPVVTLNGDATLTIACGTAFTDPGATAIDACEGAIAPLAITGSVDTSTPGSYPLTYAATDTSDNTGSAVRTVNVVDVIPPVLTLNGNATLDLECGSAYTEPGFTATDTCDGTLTSAVEVTGAVDSAVPGAYTLTYRVADAAGNEAETTRTITVADTTAPAITLLGAASIAIACGATYVEPGATATDACDGTLTSDLEISGAIDSATPGAYTITYSVTDAAGNTASLERTVTVVDSVAPVITLIGAASLELGCGDVYVESGATAEDACDGPLTSAVEILGTVNTGSPGPYTVTYRVQDASGNLAETTRTVVVQADCDILITRQPIDLNLYEGSEAVFRVEASGGVGALSYDWRKDEVSLGLPSQSRIALSSITVEDAGVYTCEITDGVSSVTSAAVTLQVFARPTEGQQSADIDGNWSIALSELLRLIQFYNLRALSCDPLSEDGYAPVAGDQTCTPHDTDYNEQDWQIVLTELLRAIQFYNTPGGQYHRDDTTEDGLAPGAA
jgi:hypothetical protein